MKNLSAVWRGDIQEQRGTFEACGSAKINGIGQNTLVKSYGEVQRFLVEFPSFELCPVEKIEILPPVRWARRDKPHWDHYVGICEVVKRKPSTLKKGFTFNNIADSCSRASLALQAGRNDDKEVFFVFDKDIQRASLSLNPCLSNN